ncbi:MAG TPA: type I DNA topoisomerase [Candidatus Paceibacterota bacterium]
MTKTSGRTLLIVESPAKAKTVAKYLGRDYEVLASVGHIRDLPKSNKNAIDVPAGFVPHYEIVKGKETIVENLRQAAKAAKEVILATDPDREGEAIAWHIAEVLNSRKPQRIVFHEITKEAVADALAHPRRIDENLRRAQEARRVLDRLFGYDLSGLIWRKLRYGLSAGRVQSPALRILVEREKLIRAFQPEPYWVIKAELETAAGKLIIFDCSLEPKTEVATEKILIAARAGAWRILAVTEEETRRQPRAPFITSTLQQTASSRLGFSPSVTMRHAQRLYEAGHITYMRTDSTNLNVAAADALVALARAKFGDAYATDRRVYKTASKNAQEAHEAIRPTKISEASAGHGPAERKLYELIWRRALASQMTEARLRQTKITAGCADVSVPPFSANGQRIIFDGWLAADPAARNEEVELPKVSANETLTLKKIDSERKETAPAARYTEAGLVKELEKRGLGRPSTYATIIKHILDRGYVTKLNRALQPTATGETVSDFLSVNFENYISDAFTATMENNLDEIAAGELKYVTLLKNFYGPFQKAVQAKKDLPKINNLGAAPAALVCPKCGGLMVWKLGRSGKFLSCRRFPECIGARLESGAVLAEPKDTGELCPNCGTGKLVERTGRFGPFIACANYPKCKYIKRDPNDQTGDTGVKCPICQAGTLTAKRGRYGVFYGCTNYPKCKYIVKNKPTGKICGYPRPADLNGARPAGPCPYLMMAGTKTIPDRCSDKTCPNHQPHKLTDVKAKNF